MCMLTAAAGLHAATGIASSDTVVAITDTATTAPLMRDVFASMPVELAPMVTRNNRLDCIDFIENDMEARVRNTIDEYVTLEALTKDYARFRTSPSGYMELKLMADSVLCVVRTVEAGRDSMHIEDSRVAFFTPQWEPLATEQFFRMPELDAFVTKEIPALTQKEAQAIAALRYFCPMRVTLSAEDCSITVIPQLGDLEPELRDAARTIVREKVITK